MGNSSGEIKVSLKKEVFTKWKGTIRMVKYPRAKDSGVLLWVVLLSLHLTEQGQESGAGIRRENL